MGLLPMASSAPKHGKLFQTKTCRGYPGLQLGSEGGAVALLQRCLRRMGFYTGPISGVFDAPTDAAVRQQQQALGLVVDGTVGDQTWSFLG
jgi:peptidoglycan hydrolase-like protein with peptidoglycan-binding domain